MESKNKLTNFTGKQISLEQVSFKVCLVLP